jgi:hypothetical protein
MSIRLFVAALAVVAVPMAVSGQQPAPQRKAEPVKRYCEAYSDVQSRLSGRRRCQSRAERDALKQESRQVVDRIQTMKATSAH